MIISKGLVEALADRIHVAEARAEISLRLCIHYMLTGDVRSLDRAKVQIIQIVEDLERLKI